MGGVVRPACAHLDVQEEMDGPFEHAAEAYRLLDENPGQAPAVILDY